MSQVYALLQPGWADWEAGYILSGLRRIYQRDVIIATPDGKPQKSIGGLNAYADLRLDILSPQPDDILLLIGSEAWQMYTHQTFFSLLCKALKNNVIVGAICAGTIAIARAGLLDGRPHTSNGRAFLAAAAPNYAGADHYVNSPNAITAGRLVTASGLSALSFACTIFRLIDPEGETPVEYWDAYARDAKTAFENDLA